MQAVFWKGSRGQKAPCRAFGCRWADPNQIRIV